MSFGPYFLTYKKPYSKHWQAVMVPYGEPNEAGRYRHKYVTRPTILAARLELNRRHPGMRHMVVEWEQMPYGGWCKRGAVFVTKRRPK